MSFIGQDTDPAFVEKREGAGRQTTMRLAHITLPSGEVIHCVIRDLSLSGAKLGVARRYLLPERFAITVSGRDVSFPVRRVWRRGDFAGVTLLTGAEALEP